MAKPPVRVQAAGCILGEMSEKDASKVDPSRTRQILDDDDEQLLEERERESSITVINDSGGGRRGGGVMERKCIYIRRRNNFFEISSILVQDSKNLLDPSPVVLAFIISKRAMHYIRKLEPSPREKMWKEDRKKNL